MLCRVRRVLVVPCVKKMEKTGKYTRNIIASRAITSSQDNCNRVSPQREIMVRCSRCRALLYVKDWMKKLKVCPQCQYHFRLSAYERIALLFDPESFVESDSRMRSVDPLHFANRWQSYADRLREEEQRTGLREAVVIGSGCIEGYTVTAAVMDFRFIGGSMGSVVGEKIARAIEQAEEQCTPLLIISASGGARIQEGILSLMQMAKISVALAHFSEARLPFISLLTDPTMGGVTASFALSGDVILAEPGALIGFAGPRVIEQFLHQKLPVDTDTSEFMLAHGMIDAVVPRHELRAKIAHILSYYKPALKKRDQEEVPLLAQEQERVRLSQQYTALHLQSSTVIRACEVDTPHCLDERQEGEGCWEQVQLARHAQRPHTEDYVKMACKDFLELRGDRCYADDQAILGGLTTIAGQTVMLIGHQKGRDSKQRLECHFGMPRPEGYRKVQRLLRLAEKFRFPVVCFIDTPGASADLESEQRGQARAIAESLKTLATLRVPILSVIIGEGGSGGALALGLADRVLMLEHAIYTVAAPEAAASILWRDDTLAPQAAEAMQVSAQSLLAMGVIDGIIREPAGGAHLDYAASTQLLMEQVGLSLAELTSIPINELLLQRYAKFRRFGCFSVL
jgi:acyl-CoA carboxylase subunit beta